jgi:hypothetical protein
LIYLTRGIHCTVTNKFTIEYFQIEENDPNKLIEGEDFIIRLKVINALPKTHLKGVVVVRMSLPEPLTPMEKKNEI